jgi:hypothetical protein
MVSFALAARPPPENKKKKKETDGADPSISNRLQKNKANLVIQNTTERIFAGGMYCDTPRGILIVRGENVLLLGEIV